MAGSPTIAPVSPGPVSLVDGAALPLAFIGTGLAALIAAAAWLSADAFHGGVALFHPHTLGVVHLWIPGFLLSVCLGASYQLLPVILGTTLRGGSAWRWLHLGLHGGGAAGLAVGLGTGHYLAAAAGGLAITAGTTGFLSVVLRTFASSRRRDFIAWSLPISATWLWSTTTAGVIIAANRHHPFLPGSAPDLLKAHAHLGLAGYFLTLLQGVAFQLVPMFTLGQARRTGLAASGLACAQLGLLALVPGLATGAAGFRLAGAALIIGGMTLSGAALGSTLATRRRRALDASLHGFVAGLLLLGLGGVGGFALLLLDPGPEATVRAGLSYGLAVIVGGLTCSVLGMLGRILPFLVWMRSYGPRVGRSPVPAATQLAPPGFEPAWLRIHLAATAVLIASAWLNSSRAFAAGSFLLLLGLSLWLLHAARILQHLSSPQPAPFAPPLPR